MQPRCDVIVDVSGELSVVVAGDWDEPEQAGLLLRTLQGLRNFGAPSHLDIEHLGNTSQEIRHLLAQLG